ncbi:TetR/AcrR family transcriptional regulator [Amycolatopsis silviterrae]|uniref:TetR/AcrR family transcriptional regulator n=1 Tax=Amycolatopsis silviterrae TaxID=1656914 RepID=A0ABW5HBN9_9PSEU
MPKQVDHDSRRAHLADAVCSLVSTRGLESVTLREVATEAGVSMGAVQRCFRTKAEMLLFAQEHVNREVAARARARIGDGAAAVMLEQALTALLAVDDPGLVSARVWIAFTAQAVVDPALAAAHEEHYAGLTEMLTVLLKAAQDSGEVRTGLDLRQEVDAVLTLADGLTLQVLLGRHTPESAVAELRRQTRHLWA